MSYTLSNNQSKSIGGTPAGFLWGKDIAIIYWIEILEKLFYIKIWHVCLTRTSLVFPQLSSTSYWTKYSPYFAQTMCNDLDHTLQDHINLGAKFNKSTVSSPKISRELRIGYISRGDERFSHRRRCDSLYYFLPRLKYIIKFCYRKRLWSKPVYEWWYLWCSFWWHNWGCIDVLLPMSTRIFRISMRDWYFWW